VAGDEKGVGRSDDSEVLKETDSDDSETDAELETRNRASKTLVGL
jgi:hypothetical protein